MFRQLLFRVTGSMPCRIISIDGEPYLERYFLCRIFGITAYLHRFVSGDGDRDVHDHPWGWALSWILAGSYVEEVLNYLCLSNGFCSTSVRRRRFSFNRIGPGKFHRIAHTEPETWTLFVHGGRIKHWGFFTWQPESAAAVVYHNPYDAADPDWHLGAPSGRSVQRAPMVVV